MLPETFIEVISGNLSQTVIENLLCGTKKIVELDETQEGEETSRRDNLGVQVTSLSLFSHSRSEL